jgi:hypothetical protein
MKRWTFILVVSLAASRAAPAATVIDDFSDGSTVLLTPGSDEDGGLANVIGGVRGVDLPEFEGACWVNSDPYGGQTHLEKGFNLGMMTLSYGNKTTNGSDLDLNWRSGGNLLLDVAESVECRLEVTINGGQSDFTSKPLDVVPGTFAVPLSDFSGLNLADVDGLQFRFNVSGPNVLPGSVTLASIETDAVPEPSAVVLLSVGAAAAVVAGRRRRRCA